MHTLLAQQQSAALHPRVVLQPKGDAWQWWTPELISMVTQCPVAGVVEDWPLIYGALELYGIADYNTCRAAIATIAIETAHTFKPVREAFWLDDQLGHERAEQWRANNLRYYPYYGRGHIQLTWQTTTGTTVGVLVTLKYWTHQTERCCHLSACWCLACTSWNVESALQRNVKIGQSADDSYRVPTQD